nr:hypothetical protein Iba_chr13cCG3610 [Ipomoea batatas]
MSRGTNFPALNCCAKILWNLRRCHFLYRSNLACFNLPKKCFFDCSFILKGLILCLGRLQFTATLCSLLTKLYFRLEEPCTSSTDPSNHRLVNFSLFESFN